MYTCIIADDEASSLETLKEYAEKAPGIRLTGSFSRSIDALAVMQSEQPPDIAFLDISMEGLNGLELARLSTGRTKIILVTAHREFAVEAYSLGVTHYLLKPLSFEAFLSAVQKASKFLDIETPPRETQKYIFVSTGVKSNMVKIFFDDIVYIKGLKNYVIIYMEASKQVSYLGITETQASLPSGQFLRVHRSYIVNSNKILGINGNMLKIANSDPIPIGKIYKDAFFKSIAGSIVLSKH